MMGYLKLVCWVLTAANAGAFVPQSSVLQSPTTSVRSIQNERPQRQKQRWADFYEGSTSSSSSSSIFSSAGTTSSTRLHMAFDTKGRPSNMFDGPAPLVKERDACGVGFIANTQSGEEFGTHKVIQQGLAALGCMEHRGACGGDGVSGDGAGIMTQIPWKLFAEFRSENCPQPGVGMVFLPRDAERRKAAMQVIEDVCNNNELDFIGWREVPVDPSVLGENARKAQPHIMQFFVKAPKQLNAMDDKERDGFERTLYLVRRRFCVELASRGLVWDDDDNVIPMFTIPTISTSVGCTHQES